MLDLILFYEQKITIWVFQVTFMIKYDQKERKVIERNLIIESFFFRISIKEKKSVLKNECLYASYNYYIHNW